jgi:hypothetical protein
MVGPERARQQEEQQQQQQQGAPLMVGPGGARQQQEQQQQQQGVPYGWARRGQAARGTTATTTRDEKAYGIKARPKSLETHKNAMFAQKGQAKRKNKKTFGGSHTFAMKTLSEHENAA